MKSLPAEDLEHVLEHTGDLWEELRAARLFITGGTGFFGKWLLESFAAANARYRLDAKVFVLTRSSAAFRTQAAHFADVEAVELIDGDVRSFAFPATGCTHVIHAATPASARINAEEPEAMLDTIVAGTRRTLQFARECGARRVLLTSSGAVYGRQPASVTHVSEDFAGGPDPLVSGSAYGEGKRAAELLAAIAVEHHRLPVAIARCFAFVGPHLPLDAHFAIGNFLRDGLAGGPIRVGGDGTPFRSYLHAADLAIWLWTMLLRAQPGRAYNVGSEQALSIAELAELIATSFQTEVQVASRSDPARLPERYVPCTRRAAEELGLKGWIDLSEAVERTIRWHRQQ